MKVFKFGGASINSVERIKNVSSIFKSYTDEKILVVISAMGKTTNALEKIVDAFYEKKNKEALQLFEEVKLDHLSLANLLTDEHANLLTDFFTEVEWLLHDKPVKDYNYY